MKFSIPVVAWFLLALTSAHADVSDSDFENYQQAIQAETRPGNLENIAKAILRGAASYDVPPPPGSRGVLTLFASNLSPQQSLTLLQKTVSQRDPDTKQLVLSKEQLALLQKLVDQSSTTLKKGVEKDRGHDLLLFAQLPYQKQLGVCQETKADLKSWGTALASLMSDSDAVLSFPKGGLSNVTLYAQQGSSKQVASYACAKVFDGSKGGQEAVGQNQAIEQINEAASESAGSAE